MYKDSFIAKEDAFAFHDGVLRLMKGKIYVAKIIKRGVWGWTKDAVHWIELTYEELPTFQVR